MTRRSVRHPFSSTLLLLACACGGDDAPPRGAPSYGTLVIEWSIDGEKVPMRCEGLGSNGFEALLHRLGSARFVEVEAPCDDFRIELNASTGTYFVRARLVDPFDRSATTQVVSDYFDVTLAATTTMSLNFPPGTFLGGGGGGGDAGAGGEAGASD